MGESGGGGGGGKGAMTLNKIGKTEIPEVDFLAAAGACKAFL